MKIKTPIFVLSVMGAASIFLLLPVSAYSISGILALASVAVIFFPEKPKDKNVVLRLARLEWNQEQFNHNFFITGAIGTGKTNFIKNVLKQLFENVPNWGGVWVEAKGDSHRHLIEAAERAGRREDVIILEVPFNGRTIYPSQRLNILTAGSMSPGIVAQMLSEISSRDESREKNAGFFRKQLKIHTEQGIRFLQDMKSQVTAVRLHAFLCDRWVMRQMLKALGGKIEKDPRGKEWWKPDPSPWLDYWHNSYLDQPGDQLGGVVTSISNALSPFISEGVSNVFSSDLPDTFDFRDISKGKIICVVCPASYPEEKAALTQFFKGLLFQLASERYDMRRFGQSIDNQLVLFADEFQMACSRGDAHFLSILRDAKAACVASCQDSTSLFPVVGQELAKVLLGQFRNKVIFSPVSSESAKYSSDIFGEREVWKYSYGSSAGKQSNNRSKVKEPILPPSHFQNLKSHYCTILHTSRKFRRKVKLPVV